MDFAWEEFKSYNCCEAVMQTEIILDLADMVVKVGQNKTRDQQEKILQGK